MPEKKLAVGIDLGTSNSVVSVRRIGDEEGRIVDITQVVGVGQLGEKKLLPSALYVPNENELEAESVRVPWEEPSLGPLVGVFARERGALVPDRLVTSAKSWLCNSQVDRKSPILPWRSEISEGKVSPFDASRRYLSHMLSATLLDLARSGDAFALEDCEVVLTVPASFDEVARSLTHEAAESAGWGNVTLLEEPQAAFYSWIAGTGKAWRAQVKPGDIVLVCDVGGGTADFSLVLVSESSGNLELDRISVGEHILLGGDNMDLALAHAIRGQLEQEGTVLDNWQFLSLVHSSRIAKESLLSEGSPEDYPVSIPSRGSSLFAKTVSTRVSRELAERVVLDGFVPMTKIEEKPQTRRTIGLQEFGLAYAADPALSKHLARFLARSMTNVRSDERLLARVEASASERIRGDHLIPSAILFNGGVFKSEAIRQRVLSLIRSWAGQLEVSALAGADLDLAVARGAAEYGHRKVKGEGIRIRAGAARSYYLGLESSTPAVPGYQPPMKGLCIVPQGMEEGTQLDLEQHELGLLTGEEATFRLFSSSIRAGDRIGSVVDNAGAELEETSSVSVTLPAAGEEEDVVPVFLRSSMTEVGTLELWMRHARSDKQWKLEFNVRTQ